MAASANDMLQKVGVAGTLTSLSAPGHSISGTTITVGSTTNWPTDTGVTFAIRQVDSSGDLVAGTYTEWRGVVSGSTLTGMVLAYGTDQVYPAGSTTQVYIPVSAYSHNRMIDALTAEHSQLDGTHTDITADTVTATTGTFTNLTVSGTATSQGWTPLGDVPDTVTANGNRNYDIVFNGVDHTSTLSPGMKMLLTRTVAAPDQCTDLEASSSQYFNKTSPAGMTFTDDFVVSAWVKLESYADMAVASRYNGTSGWTFYVNSVGQIVLQGYNAGAANYSLVQSYTSIPLNKWVHIAAQLDMSTFTATTTTSYVMVDGLDVTSQVGRGGSNPTALIQAGNLEVGGRNGGLLPFDGKIAQVAIYSAKVTQANVKATMSQGLSGSETSLISAYSFDNSLLDLNANDNDLTAQGSAVATNADSPFANAVTAGLLEYAEVNSVAFSTNTTVNVRVPDTCQIPTSGGVSAVSYSTQSNPYGLPYFSRVIGYAVIMAAFNSTTTPAFADISGLSCPVVVPTGARIKITLKASRMGMTGGGYITYAIREGSTIIDQSIQSLTNASICVDTDVTLLPTSGSHTYVASIAQNVAGTMNVQGGAYGSAAADGLAYLQVELV